MALPSNTIDKVQVGSTPFDISAKYIRTADTTPAYKTWEDITKLVNIGTKIVALDTLPPLTTVAEQKAAFNNYVGDIILIPDSTTVTPGLKLEYVGLTGKSSGASEDDIITSWEQIGTTEANLTDYAKKGTYNTSNGGSGTTGEGGAETAAGTVSVTYKKSDAATGAAGKHTHTVTTHQHAATVTAVGTLATASINNVTDVGAVPTRESVTVATGAATTGGTFSALKSVTAKTTADVLTGVTVSATTPVIKTALASASLDVKTAATTGYQAVVTAQGKLSGGSASGTFNTDAIKDITLSASDTSTDGPVYISAVSGTFNTGAIKSISGTKNYGFSTSTSKVMTAPTVSAAGVLSWTEVAASTQDAHTGDAAGTANVSKTTKYMKHTNTAASTANVSYTAPTLGAATTKYIAVTTTNSTATVDVATAVEGSGTASAITALTTTSDTALKTLATVSIYQITGVGAVPTITPVTVATGASTTVSAAGATSAVTLTSSEVAAHTHSIGLTDTTASGSASVPISAHTHSIGNHTHSVTI